MTAPQATLLAAAIALAGVLINVVSARWIRRQERNEKQQDWLRDKKVKDAEEIIPTLSRFLKTASNLVLTMNAARKTDVETLISDTQKLREEWEAEGEYLEFFARTASFKGFDKVLETITKTNRKLLELSNEITTWSGYEALQLSIWFDPEDQLNLSDLGNTFAKHCFDVHVAASDLERNLQTIRSALFRRESTVADEDIEAAKRFNDVFEEAVRKQLDFENIVLDFQLALADRFKMKPNIWSASRQNEGLMVLIAKWIEKRMLYLF